MFSSPQIVLFSDNLVRLAAFYRQLGFKEVFRTPDVGEPIHVDLELDGYRIGIASGASTRDDHGLAPLATGQRLAVVLWTDDVTAAGDALRAAGAVEHSGPHRWLDRLMIAWFLDPDGNPLQAVQALPPD